MADEKQTKTQRIAQADVDAARAELSAAAVRRYLPESEAKALIEKLQTVQTMSGRDAINMVAYTRDLLSGGDA